MILTYNKDKIYDPNTYSNKLRQSMKQEIRMNYIKRPIQIPALNLLLKIPGMKYIFKVIMYSGATVIKLLGNKEQKEFLEAKQSYLTTSREE